MADCYDNGVNLRHCTSSCVRQSLASEHQSVNSVSGERILVDGELQQRSNEMQTDVWYLPRCAVPRWWLNHCAWFFTVEWLAGIQDPGHRCECITVWVYGRLMRSLVGNGHWSHTATGCRCSRRPAGARCVMGSPCRNCGSWGNYVSSRTSALMT